MNCIVPPKTFFSTCAVWAFALVLFLLPLQTIWLIRQEEIFGSVWQSGTVGVYGTELLLLFSLCCTAVCVLPHICTRNRTGLSRNSQYAFLSICAVLFYIVSRGVFSADASLGLFAASKITYGLSCMALLVLWREHTKFFLWFFLAGMALHACIGIAFFIFQYAPASTLLGIASHDPAISGESVVFMHGARVLRAYGVLPHPNIFGGFMLGGILVALFSTAVFRMEKKEKIAVCTVVSLCAVALVCSFSRSAMFGALLLCIGVFVIPQMKRVRPYALCGLVVALCAGALLFDGYRTRVMIDSPLEARSIAERVTQFGAWQHIVSSQIWFGVGTGNYTVFLQTVQPHMPGWAYQPIHNTFALFVVEQGIWGMLFAVLAIIFFYHARKGTWQWPFFAIIVFLPVLFFDHYLYSSMAGSLLFWTSIGFAAMLPTCYPQSIHCSSTETAT